MSWRAPGALVYAARRTDLSIGTSAAIDAGCGRPRQVVHSNFEGVFFESEVIP